MENWADWIGLTKSQDSLLDPIVAQKMQVTINQEATLKTGEPLPPAWHWLYFSELTKVQDAGPDGHTKLGINVPDFGLPRRMWAGGRITWHRDLILGQVATRDSKIFDIQEKTGRSGKLVFLTLQHEITQSNQVCISEVQNIVYREFSKQTQKVELTAAPTDYDFNQSWNVDEVTLFRYSALTFNSHRIHYDADYTRNVEGYPGLVVHGPLLATLLLDLAKSNNLTVHEFSYKAVSPITLPAQFMASAKKSETGTDLWISNESGFVAMEAKLT